MLKIKNLFQDKGNFVPITFLLLAVSSLILMVSFVFIKDLYNIFPSFMPSGKILNLSTINSLNIRISNFLWPYCSIFFISFYLLPRLTGKTMYLYRFTTLVAMSTIVISIFAPVNLNNKNSLFGLPVQLSTLRLIFLIIFTISILYSFLKKNEHSLFVSGYFLLSSLVFLLVGAYSITIEFKTNADIMILNSFFVSSQIYIGIGFATMSVIFYLATKGLGGILESRPLSSIALWGYLFLLPWAGFKHYYGTYIPNWLENTSTYMSLGLIIPLLAFLSNILKTIQSSENKSGLTYSYLSNSIFLFSIGNLLLILSAVPSLLPLTSFTLWDSAISLSFMLSFLSVLLSLYSYSIPKLLGREFVGNRVSFHLYKIGSIASIAAISMSGIYSGYLWSAGANSGMLTTFGEGYRIVWGVISPLLSIQTIGSMLILFSCLVFFIDALRSITSGSIVPQEVFKEVEKNE